MTRRPLRVVVTGSECTGKTTLAGALSARFGVGVVPEFSRLYAATKLSPLSGEDVEPIARGQMAREDAAMDGEPSLLILDTDLVSTVLYARHYYGSCPEWIERSARARQGDLYLLCCPDVPWVGDGIRDRGDRREEMHGLFEALLRELSIAWCPIQGAWREREESAVRAVRSLSRDSCGGRPPERPMGR